MTTFYGISSDSVSTLFSGLSTSNTKNGLFGTSNNLSYLSEYSNIRNGSYQKLLDAYYKKYGTNNSKSEATTNIVSTDSVKQLSETKKSGDDLATSVNTLLNKGSKSVFSKVDKKNTDGTTTNDYDRERIDEAVNDFAQDYNSLIKEAGNSGVQAIKKEAKNMVSTTKANENLLKSVGITINSDNTLNVDKDALKKADVTTLKSIFNTTGSYGYTIGSKASQISSKAAFETGKTNTYTNSGSYSSISSGELYDSLF